MNLSTEVRMIKGVGPQRAELLAQRGIYTLEDLLGYLPFRYEDRIHFSKVKDIQPNGIYTIRARVMSGPICEAASSPSPTFNTAMRSWIFGRIFSAALPTVREYVAPACPWVKSPLCVEVMVRMAGSAWK